jgi:uncharacterized protein
VDRLFLDANILFSAAYREDAGVAVLWSSESVILCASPYVIEEASRNLVERDQKKRLQRLIQSLHLVQSVTAPEAILRAVELPDQDWPILAGAIAAEATHLITGDRKHFGAYFGKRVHGILVLPPSDCIRDATRAS